MTATLIYGRLYLVALMTQLNAFANITGTNAITVTLTQSHVTPVKGSGMVFP